MKVRENLSISNKYLQESKYEEEVLIFRDVIKIHNKNVKARVGLGKVYLAVNKSDEGEKIIKEALAIDKTKRSIYILDYLIFI